MQCQFTVPKIAIMSKLRLLVVCAGTLVLSAVYLFYSRSNKGNTAAVPVVKSLPIAIVRNGPLTHSIETSTATALPTLGGKSTVAEPTVFNNPGCQSKVIRHYKPRVPGPEYHHPSIIHYVKLYSKDGSEGSLLFREFLAIMSAYKFYRPEQILLHSNADFSADKYWQQAQKWKNISVKVNPVKVLTEIGGQHVIKLHHVADYLKIKTLIEQGGLASDFDVIILDGKKLREQQRRSECLLSCEMHDLTFQKCIKINGGFYSCAKNTAFMRSWFQVYQTDFRPKDWAYNSGDVPSRILRTKGPQCYNVWTDEEILSPSPGYVNRWMLGSVNWRTKPAAHYISRFTGLRVEDERILKLRTPLGDMMRHVYNTKV